MLHSDQFRIPRTIEPVFRTFWVPQPEQPKHTSNPKPMKDKRNEHFTGLLLLLQVGSLCVLQTKESLDFAVLDCLYMLYVGFTCSTFRVWGCRGVQQLAYGFGLRDCGKERDVRFRVLIEYLGTENHYCLRGQSMGLRDLSGVWKYCQWPLRYSGELV